MDLIDINLKGFLKSKMTPCLLIYPTTSRERGESILKVIELHYLLI